MRIFLKIDDSSVRCERLNGHPREARLREGGAIVNLSSAAATIGSPGEFTWYAASKGAIAFVEYLTGLGDAVAFSAAIPRYISELGSPKSRSVIRDTRSRTFGPVSSGCASAMTCLTSECSGSTMQRKQSLMPAAA